jgi:hypothetical protein
VVTDNGGAWFDRLGIGTVLGQVGDKVGRELTARLNIGDQDPANELKATGAASHDALGRPLSGGTSRLVVIGAALLAVVLVVAYARR